MIPHARGRKENSGPGPSEAGLKPKGKVLVDMGSAVIAEAVSSLLQGYGYQCYTSEPPACGLDVIIVDSSTIDKKTADFYPESKVILLETDAHARNIARPILFQKVHGIISHSADSAKFRKALEAIADGQVWIDNTTIKNFLLDAGLLSHRGKILGFTPQEKIIVESICRGDTNKEIALKLYLSIHTVKTHLRSIMRKAGAVNRSHLASMVTQCLGEDKQDAEQS
jgi:DNA-binding NarL/FixJ family response regulator